MFYLKIDETFVGKRIDKLLAEQLPQYSRAYLKKLFVNELVSLNDNAAKAGTKLRFGDVIKADISTLEVTIPDIELPIIYEDKDVLVVDKPAGVIAHARGRYFDEPSVASFVRQKTKQIGERAGIVHRLDRATSGVMICAKNEKSLSYLQKQFQDHKVVKEYVAVTDTHPKEDTAIIDAPIARDSNNPKKFRVDPHGKSAQTEYKTTTLKSGNCFWEIKPKTGRTHQIRVHLSYLNCPIIGDELYAGKSAERLYLHAKKLVIKLPNGELKVFSSNVPKEFKI